MKTLTQEKHRGRKEKRTTPSEQYKPFGNAVLNTQHKLQVARRVQPVVKHPMQEDICNFNFTSAH